MTVDMVQSLLIVGLIVVSIVSNVTFIRYVRRTEKTLVSMNQSMILTAEALSITNKTMVRVIQQRD